MEKDLSYKIYLVGFGILSIELLVYALMTVPLLLSNSYNVCYNNNFTYYFPQQNVYINFLNCTMNTVYSGS